MKIRKRRVDEVVILDLEGSLLAEGTIVLKEAIGDLVKSQDTRVVLDLEQCPDADSSGIAEIVSSYSSIRESGGALKLMKLSEKMKWIMNVTQLITVFEVYDDEEEAISSFQ